jgi:hypothetical protein
VIQSYHFGNLLALRQSFWKRYEVGDVILLAKVSYVDFQTSTEDLLNARGAKCVTATSQTISMSESVRKNDG